jgi:hypothetical protein
MGDVGPEGRGKIISSILSFLHFKSKVKRGRKNSLNQFYPLLLYWNYAVILFGIMDLLDREKSLRGGGLAEKKEIQVLCLLGAVVHSWKAEY